MKEKIIEIAPIISEFGNFKNVKDGDIITVGVVRNITKELKSNNYSVIDYTGIVKGIDTINPYLSFHDAHNNICSLPLRNCLFERKIETDIKFDFYLMANDISDCMLVENELYFLLSQSDDCTLVKIHRLETGVIYTESGEKYSTRFINTYLFASIEEKEYIDHAD